MRSLVLAVLVLALCAAPAAAQVTLADPADAPGSVYDIESLAVGYDPGGTVRVTWRLHQPLPVTPPEPGTAYLAASVFQRQDYSLGCRATGDAGDLSVVLDYSAPLDAPLTWDAGYHVWGRDGMTEVPLTFSADRREVTATVTDPLLAGRPYFCAGAMSEAGVRDDTEAAYFPGFEPLAPVLLGPADGALLRGTTPELGWETRPSSLEQLRLYRRDPATGGAPFLVADATGRNALGAVVGTRTGSSFRLAQPLKDGVYWWGVERGYGRTTLKTYRRFEIGPPDLTRLTVARRITAPKSRSRRGKAQLTVTASRGATGTLVVKRGGRTVRSAKFTIKTDETRLKVTIRLSCATPGRYTATVRASDRYGQRRTAKTSWSVSRNPCLSR